MYAGYGHNNIRKTHTQANTYVLFMGWKRDSADDDSLKVTVIKLLSHVISNLVYRCMYHGGSKDGVCLALWLQLLLLTSRCNFILAALRDCVLADEVASHLPDTPYRVTEQARV